MPYVFGPVPSRRLGLSLGVDLIPAKTCTYECLYCQVGKTTCKTLEAKDYVPVQMVLSELKETLEKTRPDTITLAGSGEPTLNSRIDHVISSIKKITDIKIAVLTNGSLFWDEEIRGRVSGADIILPTLSTVFPETFRAIHRPHPGILLDRMIQGLKDLRRDYRGLIFLEVVLLEGINDSDKELRGLERAIREIEPDKIQLNTVVRPPADSRARPIDMKRLESIKAIFGDRAEVVAEASSRQEGARYDSLTETVLEIARRRPVRATDLAQVLNVPLAEVERLIHGLRLKGRIKGHEHAGEVYYGIAC